MSWYDHNTGWWGFAGMGIGMILFWSLIIVRIIVLIHCGTQDLAHSSSPYARAGSGRPLRSRRDQRHRIPRQVDCIAR
jgi:putative membrane protein